ncbi:MAG: hypothetical protein WBA23_21005 [Tunicatimonas sp.]|uniref:hypothetical protein n=1 Tax=Tunicatimonas sp. TaxID=1940096 RepID=UPI003C765598
MSATVANGTGTITYSIASQSVAGAVSISANGELTIADISAFDHETNAQITGKYLAKVGSATDRANFIITVDDVDDITVTATDFTSDVDENSASGTIIGTVTTTLTDGTGTLSYSIVNQSIAGAVSINSDGELEVATVNVFDYETNTQITGTYEVEVTGSTSANRIATADFTIDLNDKYSWTKAVFAGQAGSISTTDGTGTAARFNEPLGMDFDASGNNLYVADKNNHRIRRITVPGAVVTTLAGSTSGYLNGTGSTARFDHPRDVVVDGSGNVWVADSDNNALRKITTSGVVSNTTLTFTPNGIAFSGGAIYVTRDHQINKFDLNTTSIVNGWILGGGAAGNNSFGYKDDHANRSLFYNPRGIDLDANGNWLVADYENRTVRKIAPTYGATGFNRTYFQITDVAVAPDGKIYAVESGNERVREVTSNLTSVEEIIADGFNRPEGIAIHPTTGEIYVADTGAHCIYKLTKVEE